MGYMDGKVLKVELSAVIEDLQSFKDFVLASEYGDELVAAYAREGGQ